MSKRKIYDKKKNVYEASIERFEYIFDEFENIYLSFSAGKDSSVMLQLALQVAEKKGKLPLNVLLIDLEGQYKETMRHCEEMMNDERINGYWICLPFRLRNAVSMYEPNWVCWDKDKKDIWVREMPQHKYTISDYNYFPFFRYGMEFEDFVVDFGKWISNGKKTCCLVGIRADESMNRFRTLIMEKKTRYKGKNWTTLIKNKEGIALYNAYPIYDYRTEDIWRCVGKNNFKYNKIYDLMHLQGRGIHDQRICQPYGDDQRKGLDLFHECEPETWFKVVNRVSGANLGAIYKGGKILGNIEVELPIGHTYKSYTRLLLESMPPYLAEHFIDRITTFINWYKDKGYTLIPDENDKKLEASRKVPSWRRICKCVLKNDYFCKSLSFGQNTLEYMKMIDKQKKFSKYRTTIDYGINEYKKGKNIDEIIKNYKK